MKTLNNNIKKLSMLLFLLFTIMTISMMPVSAASVNTSVVNTTVSGATLNETDLTNTNNPAGIPEASIDKLQSKLEKKMFNIVTLLQVIGKPFFVICFIISIVITIFGIFGARGGAWKGILGMFASGVLYACVMYAPEIVEWIQLFMIS